MLPSTDLKARGIDPHIFRVDHHRRQIDNATSLQSLR
jgi:hypothetical protein